MEGPNHTLQCDNCHAVCERVFKTIDFFAGDEDKGSYTFEATRRLGFCHSCGTLRLVLYSIWWWMREQDSSIPDHWRVAIVRWRDNRIAVVWG